ncbi:timeless protein-domain-containing protein [Schizothecium vesticola]|uniref:Topoisomerase 1-associated factor 1 n=1 Tax=Schizothecium vesticola TaxID=314040 RepID=A0AA40KDD0_9PEZI|nr:timeless protein-domain-containing protein [Schizothecium vesticola]
MEAAEVNSNDVVHPEVRAHINSLVSALGGWSVDDDGYKLGDDALEVLRDLKRWIRFYDEKTNRMDVARCLAEANIVANDLLYILATWPQSEADNKTKAKTALACFEVMVPLTWPIDKDRETMTVNHHRHIPVLQLAQVGYKRAIINFDATPILNTAVRVALPSMALPSGDRTPRDQGIIKLVLYFLRNIAMINPAPGFRSDDDELQISRSTLIDAFSFQDIFLALLTISSNMGEDFRTEDLVVMETIFHLVKRVDSSKLFVSEKTVHKVKADELAAAMSKEAAMLKSYSKHAPTRHSRFGTMIWVKRESGKLKTVTGQEALLDPAARERKMDKSKTFKPPKKARKEEMEPKDLGPLVTLDERARQQLGSFVSEFLDAGFNPLFSHCRKSIDREAPHVMDAHKGQFFYLVAWFLEAERMRRKARQESKTPVEDDISGFSLVASVLNQEMFITLNRYMERAYTDKDWQLLSTVMRCLTQILLTVQEMSDSGSEENEEIADNILSRLFYEEATHDAVANIIRTYKDQGFEYLDAATELTHTYVRILEAYSKQNVDLQVRSKKRKRRKKKAAKETEGEDAVPDDVDDDSGNDEQNAEKTVQERKFDFKRFAHRFTPQGVVDTFVTFTKYYRDLNDFQLKRAHRYFHRVAFKEDMSVMLFRLDIIHLFYNMIKGPEPMDKNSSVYKEWEELAKQIIKKCVRKLEERPALFTELLFSKINSTAHYLEYGYEKQTMSTNPRPAAELVFKREETREQQIAIVVGAILDKGQLDHLEWIRKQLSNAGSERRAWENAEKAMISAANPGANGLMPDVVDDEILPKPAPHTTVLSDTDTRRTAMFKNPYLRLLMALVGMERLTPTLDETPDAAWILPGTLTADDLQSSLDLISKAEFSPPVFDNGEAAADQLRRKSAAAPRKRVAYDDDDDLLLDDDNDEEAALFPAGGPTARRPTGDDAPRPKKRQRRRRVAASGDESEADGPADELLAEKARLRREKELEKARKIKSEMYVRASDDETDEERDREFFAREKQRQVAKDKTFGMAEKPVVSLDRDVLRLGGESEEEEEEEEEDGDDAAKRGGKKTIKGKRTLDASDDDDDDDDDEAEGSDSSSAAVAKASPPKRRKKKPAKKAARAQDEGEEMGDASPSPSSEAADPPAEPDVEMADTPPGAADKTGAGDDDDDEEDLVVAPVRARQRARGGFVVDSSDDE